MFKVPENLKSKYEFVTLAAKRAEQLQSGALPRVAVDSTRVTVVAQAEVAAGLVTPFDAEQQPAAAVPDEEEDE